MVLIDKNVNESKQNDNPEDSDKIQKVAELEALIAIKNNEIIKLKQAENNLQKENENNKQQAERIKRVATNMFKELEEFKSRK